VTSSFRSTTDRGLVVLVRCDERQQVEQEVDVVEVDLHRQLRRPRPRVFRVAQGEEVVDEIAGEDEHADRRIQQVRLTPPLHEQPNDADDDQKEEPDAEEGAETGEVDTGEGADQPAHRHDTTGSEERESHGFPADVLRVSVNRRPDEETGDERPDCQREDTGDGTALRDRRHCEAADEHEDEQYDEAEDRFQLPADVTAHAAHGHGDGEKKRHFGVDREFHS
jgi:hypothetical protein